MNLERIKKSIVCPKLDETIPFYKFAPQIQHLLFVQDRRKFHIYKILYYDHSTYCIKLIDNDKDIGYWSKKLGQFFPYEEIYRNNFLFDNIFDPIAIVEHCLDTDNYVVSI